ncbi:MAG: PEP/pyruvate-binding domain-containing protein, partial [Actinomycetota bacterium]
MNDTSDHVRWFSDLTSDDVAVVGGKNASLGEMIQRLESEGIRVPQGFATTADAYRAFVADNELGTVIEEQIDALERGTDLAEVGAAIRDAFREGGMPSATDEVIRAAYRQLCEEVGREDVDVAVRSSATAEDMPEASFAGQQETYLNIRGEDAVVAAVVACYASLFTDRAIAYRQEQGFGHLDVALSAGVQRMVRSDLAGAGVAFTLDTETGFPDVVSIDAAWGLGEVVVAGEVNPDAYVVFKPLLDEDGCRPIVTKDLGDKRKKIVYAEQGGEPTRTEDTSEQEQRTFVLDDDEILTLARWCTAIERHYDQPMDIEWAKDGDTGELFVVQARPETVQSQRQGAQLSTFRLTERGEVLSSGVAIGDAIATG